MDGKLVHDRLSQAAAALGSGRLPQAKSLCEEVLAAIPDCADALFLLAGVADRSGNLAEAVRLLELCVARDHKNAQYRLNLGDALCRMGRYGDGIVHLQAALAAKESAEARYHLALAYQAANRLEQAAAEYEKVIAIRPDIAPAHYNLGVIFQAQGDMARAASAYESAVAAKGDYLKALNNLGSVYTRLRRFSAAATALRRALELRPDYPSALTNLGNCLADSGRIDEAMPLLRRAVQTDLASAGAHSALLLNMLRDPASTPEQIRQELSEWNARHARPLGRNRAHANLRAPGRRLRLGFVSGELRDGVIAWNTMPLFRELDRSQFEIHFYSNGYREDQTTTRFRELASGFRRIAGVSDEQAARQIEEDGIDVLLDMNLHTSANRLLVFARKPAPVQISFAGYPGAAGLEAIDVRLSDVWMEPAGSPELGPERVAHLPASFWCFEPQTDDPDVNELPAEKNGYVTFGCLNDTKKLNSTVYGLFREVLRRTPNSRLILLASPGEHREWIAGQICGGEVAPERIGFVEHGPRPKYMSHYHLVDISLDTFPYAGHTTGLDSLWMAVPVVTLTGETTVSRAGLSLLANVGAPELVASEPAQYVQIATELAADRPRLLSLRQGLRQRMLSSQLCDAKLFTRGFEAIVRDAWRRWCAK